MVGSGLVSFGVFTAVEEADLATGLLSCQGREGAWSQSSNCSLSTIPSFSSASLSKSSGAQVRHTQEKAWGKALPVTASTKTTAGSRASERCE